MRLIPSPDLRRLFLPAALIAALLSGFRAGGEEPAPSSPGEILLGRLAADFLALATFQADFVQTQSWVGMDTENESWRGTMYLKRPNLFRLEYKEPAGHLQVSDGKAVWTYVPENGQVLKAALGGEPGQGGDLLRWVLEKGTAEPAVEREPLAGKEARVLTVHPPEGIGLSLVRIWMKESSLQIEQYEITDSSGNRNLYRLTRSRRNPPLKQDLFAFIPPSGVPVVEVGNP